MLQAQNISIEGVKDRVGSDVQIVYDKGYTRTARDNETYVSGQVTAANNLSIIATGKDSNVTLDAGQETSDVYQASRKETSGAFGSGAGFTIGSKELTQKQSERTLTNVGSSIGSLNGNVTIAAGNDYAQQGSQISAAGDIDIDITAKRIDIGAAADSGQSQSETKFKQSGLSISVSAPVIDSL